jgi:hypothetical protein
VYGGTDPTISYTIFGVAPSPTVRFDYHIAVHGSRGSLNRFSIVFYENMPDVVRVNYMSTSDDGLSVTTGVQSKISFCCSFCSPI